MIAAEYGRAVLHCDHRSRGRTCPARIDLGPARLTIRRLRLPTGWRQVAPDTHHCPLHDPEAPVR